MATRKKAPNKTKSKAENKKKIGRPLKYLGEETDKRAHNLALLGYKDIQIAEALEINTDTLYQWKKQYPKFSEAIQKGKEDADGKVANALYQRALGFAHPDVHISSFMGEITVTPIERYYPPDAAAAIRWLQCRQPEIWKERIGLDHAGAVAHVAPEKFGSLEEASAAYNEFMKK